MSGMASSTAADEKPAEKGRPEHGGDHAARHRTLRIAGFFRGMGGSVEARDGVADMQQAEDEGEEQAAASAARSSAPGAPVLLVKVTRREKSRSTGDPTIRPTTRTNETHHDQIAGEVGQDRRRLDAHIIQDRLRHGDERHGDDQMRAGEACGSMPSTPTRIRSRVSR